MNQDRIRIEGDTASITTKHGDVLIDTSDLCILDGMQIGLKRSTGWRMNWYARIEKTGKERCRASLARAIMRPLPGFEVDHINHNTLDNRRVNLRICTRSENARNSQGQRKRSAVGSKYKGVIFHDAKKYNPRCSATKPWRALTRVGGKRIELGYHETEEDAARAYDAYAKANFGEFACLNFA